MFLRKELSKQIQFCRTESQQLQLSFLFSNLTVEHCYSASYASLSLSHLHSRVRWIFCTSGYSTFISSLSEKCNVSFLLEHFDLTHNCNTGRTNLVTRCSLSYIRFLLNKKEILRTSRFDKFSIQQNLCFMFNSS